MDKARLHITRAQQHVKHGNHVEAVREFVNAVQLCNELSRLVASLMLDSLVVAEKTMEQQGQINELFSLYADVIATFPNIALVHSNCGSLLFRHGYVLEALAACKKAVQVDPTVMGGNDNLQNILNTIVDRWFFRMINNRERNAAYQRAIEKAIGKGYARILDIGAGTGLLSMIAARANAVAIDAVEVSTPMCRLAERCLQQNSMSDRVRLLRKHSTQVRIPEDMGERATLLVSETVDAGLLGEGMYPCLRQAALELTTPDAIVIPSSAVVTAQLVASAQFKSFMQVSSGVFENIGLNPPNYKLLYEEAYTCARLEETPHTTMSQPWSATQILFGSHPLPNDMHVHVVVTGDGIVDAVAAWWSLHLDEEVVIQTHPGSHSCWEQAVYPLHPPIYVKTNQILTITTTATEKMLGFQISSSDRAIAFAGYDAISKAYSLQPYLLLDEASIRLINDVGYQTMLATAVQVCVRSNASILELTSTWPMGAALAIAAGASSVCVDQSFDAEISELTTRGMKTWLESLGDGVVVDVRRQNENDDNDNGDNDKKYDVVIWQPLETSGLLRQKILEQVAMCRSSSTVLIPSSLIMYVECIECPHIAMDNAIDPANQLGFDMTLLNEFSVDIVLHLDLGYRSLTNPVDALHINVASDSIESLLSAANEFSCRLKSSGTIHAVLFWFAVGLAPNVVYHSRSGNDQRNMQLAASILPNNGLAVKSGDTVLINAMCIGGSVKLECTKEED